uniref:RNA-directed DNA polymerase, eukaryota, reverse transcriptase zinc-binding domain protein n=1 Tax=Tanacetum cinerariifolium TaxID=118510 RepID=A0A6L2K1D5_TANCI|nr:RNA-directed DNA polymerase, eukaryota, reverse transcriptase zinc-binding domain protein [Tanacetum cinerariifolium]
MTTLTSMCEMVCQIFQKKQEEKRIEEEQAANARYWKILTCCDDDDDYDSAITPVLSTEETENSLSMGDEHLDTIPATKSDELIKSSVENFVPILSEFKGILDTMCDVHLVNNPTPLKAKDHFEILINSNDDISSSDDESLYKENIEYVKASPHDSELVILEVAEIVTPKVEEIEDDNLREKLLNVHLLIANIEALKDNHTSSSKFLTKSSSTSSKSFLEETNTFHNSLSEFENFYFYLGEISSGSTTTHSDISLSDYEVFYFDDDHIEEISGGSTTTHSDIFLSEYDSFTFDLLNDQCPPTDRSDFTHEEFADELAHIISPPEPILLKESLVDYGPTPFRLFYSWFLEVDFLSVVQDSWSIADNNSQNHMIKFKSKLKNLKHRLKAWSCDKKYLHNKERNLSQESLLGIDLRLDQGMGLPYDVLNHSKLVRELDDLNKKESIDLAQKAKVKWAIEGDHNSKFYHGIVNKKRRFAQPDWDRVPLVDQFPRVLSLNLSRNLEAVKYWSVVGNDVILTVKEFFSTGSILNGCNPSFIALIPKRAPSNLNEVISLCKAKKEKALLFKVDFQKAFDSVRWDHLDDILDKFGFGHTWRRWIKSCLYSSKASILVNGSPTDEFSFHMGLRQGDPLSPFLFILVMGSLYISFQRLIDRGDVPGQALRSPNLVSSIL